MQLQASTMTPWRLMLPSVPQSMRCSLCLTALLLGGVARFGGYELVAFAVDVDDFDGWVVFKVLAQLGKGAL